jgi:glycosyltransferase involved in cell wall biosynthesis
MTRSKAPILIHITTVPETLGFCRGQIGYMKERGFDVQAVSSPGKLLEETGAREGIPVYAVDLTRRITPLKDLLSLLKMYRLFTFLKPTIVHGHTPKGGLIAVVAARLARVPVVIYTIHGLPFITAKGIKRQLLRWSETLACRLADRVFAVSQANKRTAVAQGFCPKDKIQILGSGSCNGVEGEERFNPQKLAPGIREELRNSYRINSDALVLGYIGRIVRDKGIATLEEAWQSLRRKYPTLYLLMVGQEEPQDPLPATLMQRLQSDPRVILTGRVGNPIPCYAAMDIVVLPTYREGFPIVPLEAAAMKVPVVATNVDGCSEAVMDGLTGLLVPPRDPQALAAAIERLILDPELRHQMGQAGRQRVLQKFRPEVIWKALYENYLELLKVTNRIS